MKLHIQRHQKQRLLRALVMPALLLASFAIITAAYAQDAVTVRDQRSGRTSTFKANVLDWDAEQLVYESNERQNKLAASRIVRVNFARTAKHLEAREQIGQGRLAQASPLLAEALKNEPRKWVKQEIYSQQIRSAAGMGGQRGALTAFFQMMDSSPNSRFFHLIPLAWEKVQVDNGIVLGLRKWLKSENDIEKLVAASWLFYSDKQDATEALQTLTSSNDSRVAHLATAQLWRRKTVDVRESDLQLWNVALQRMPENLQAGPRFRIAAAMQRLAETSNSDEMKQAAIVALLQIPILYPEQYQLSGSALFGASQILIAEGRQQEANIVKSELVGQFGFSSAALKSGGRVESLDR